LLRFFSSKSGDQMISLRDYVSRMEEGQQDIYYITSESRFSAANSFFVDFFRKKNIEVLYLIDPLDGYVTEHLKEYSGKKLINCAKEGPHIQQIEDENKILEVQNIMYQEFCKVVKEILGNRVGKVIVSTRILESPCILVTGNLGWSSNMERIMKAQLLWDDSMFSYMASKKTLEINAHHPIIRKLKRKIEQNKNDPTIKDIVWLLYETALLMSGLALTEISELSNRIYRLVNSNLSSPDEKMEEELPQKGMEQEGDVTSGSKMEETY